MPSANKDNIWNKSILFKETTKVIFKMFYIYTMHTRGCCNCLRPGKDATLYIKRKLLHY